MLGKMDNVFAADKRSLTVLFYEIPCWDSFLFWLDSRQYHLIKQLFYRNDSSLLRPALPALTFVFARWFSIVSWIWSKQLSIWAERFSIPSAYFSRFLSSVIRSVTPCFSARILSNCICSHPDKKRS